MKKRIGQVFSLALAVALMIAMAIPVHADVSDAAGYVVGEFWDMMTGQEHDMFFDYWKNFVGYLAGEECPSSPDKYHHGNVPVGGIGVFGSGGTDDNGKFVWHTCDYCGEQFKVYASDLQQSYDAQVEELPAPSYNSDGSLKIPLTVTGHYRVISGYGGGIARSNLESTHKVTFGSICDCQVYFGENKITFKLHSGASSFSGPKVDYRVSSVVPYDGFYARVLPKIVISYVTVLGESGVEEGKDSFYDSSGPVYFSAGSNISCETGYVSVPDDFKLYSAIVHFENPYAIFTPAPSVDINFDTTYNINSRPTSITGDYGIIGDNGQIIKVEGDKIVNETNNTYYNPSTGETKTMSDWSYNYEDRSYTVTTESGDTVTITYGDENVVIKEGDTTYNVYYLVNGSGSENPDPGPDVPPACNHQWAETSVTPATCTVPGSRTLTCSLCNETKTEAIPAPGHKWTVKQEVKNEYDENGNQTQEGYIIWECSVCGEQQKTTDGTAPPGGGSGTGSGSSDGVFSGIFGLLVDFLGFFWNTFRDFVGEGVKGFLNALMDGTSSIFGLLNPFNWGG